MAVATAEWRREQRQDAAGAGDGRKTPSIVSEGDGSGWQRWRKKLLKLYNTLL